VINLVKLRVTEYDGRHQVTLINGYTFTQEWLDLPAEEAVLSLESPSLEYKFSSSDEDDLLNLSEFGWYRLTNFLNLDNDGDRSKIVKSLLPTKKKVSKPTTTKSSK
tara:strand:- start:19 stop:339 length:321 start_codon:yes stop_codon:yes gene_type:complete